MFALHRVPLHSAGDNVIVRNKKPATKLIEKVRKPELWLKMGEVTEEVTSFVIGPETKEGGSKCKVMM